MADRIKRTPAETRRLKEHAWEMATDTTLPMREIARRLNVPHPTLRKWILGIERPPETKIRMWSPENRALTNKLYRNGVSRAERLSILAAETTRRQAAEQ